jgi:hypothetical protein
MPAIIGLCFRASLLAVICLVVSPAHAALQTGSVLFDGKTVHYLVFSGKDEAFFQSFRRGGVLNDFEHVSDASGFTSVTAFGTSDYTNKAVTSANLLPTDKALNGIFYSGGGQNPGSPAVGGSPFPTVWTELQNGLQGAHSGTHVLAPADPTGAELQFNGFLSFGVPTADKFSRIGFWTNPLWTPGQLPLIPNIHVVNGTGQDDDNFLVDSSINVSVQPGDFFAVAFDQPIIQEVEFVPGNHATLDDVVFARDNKVAFTVVPEPSMALLLAAGLGMLVGARRLINRR